MKEELLVQYSNVKKKSLCQRILNKKTHYSELLDRNIISNNPDPEIGNNKISTSKYNLISFPLFNLLEQFTKPSNRTSHPTQFISYSSASYRWSRPSPSLKASPPCSFPLVLSLSFRWWKILWRTGKDTKAIERKITQKFKYWMNWGIRKASGRTFWLAIS